VRRAAAAWPSRAGIALWALPVLAITAWALFHRWHGLSAPLWIDEGISVGIASHPLGDIPGLLRQDGSPPLYYALLHAWMAVFGKTEADTHALSVLFAVLGVPAVAWAAFKPFGWLAAIIAGALAAASPFLGLYADETRMYTLAFLLSALATGAYLRAFVIGSRRWAVGFGVLGALLCLTHGWGLFFGAAGALALVVPLVFSAGGAERRRLAIDALIAFAVALVIFAPWLPTQLFQVAHTGAPWSHPPKLNSFRNAMVRMLGGTRPEQILLAAGTLGFVVMLARGPRTRRIGVVTVAILAIGTILVGFAASRLGTPAWAYRYLCVVLAPLLVALGATLAATGPVGVVAALVVCLGFWPGRPTTASLSRKSDVRHMANLLRADLPPDTLVASSQPEQVPVLRYYLPAHMRYVTPLGAQRDPGVVDWRDALARLRASRVDTTLGPALASVRPGGRVLFVRAMFGRADSQWTRTVQVRTSQWRRALAADRRFRVLRTFTPRRYSSRATVGAILLQRRG
jgi:mannosyltransferase